MRQEIAPAYNKRECKIAALFFAFLFGTLACSYSQPAHALSEDELSCVIELWRVGDDPTKCLNAGTGGGGLGFGGGGGSSGGGGGGGGGDGGGGGASGRRVCTSPDWWFVGPIPSWEDRTTLDASSGKYVNYKSFVQYQYVCDLSSYTICDFSDPDAALRRFRYQIGWISSDAPFSNNIPSTAGIGWSVQDITESLSGPTVHYENCNGTF